MTKPLMVVATEESSSAPLTSCVSATILERFVVSFGRVLILVSTGLSYIIL